MAIKPTIAIIGSTGRMGSAIARSLARGDYRLLLFGRSPQRLTQLSEDIIALHPDSDVEGITCATDACWEADIVVLAVPQAAESLVASQIKPYVTQKVVVSMAGGDALVRLLPDAHVIVASTKKPRWCVGRSSDEPARHSRSSRQPRPSGTNNLRNRRFPGYSPVVAGHEGRSATACAPIPIQIIIQYTLQLKRTTS